MLWLIARSGELIVARTGIMCERARKSTELVVVAIQEERNISYNNIARSGHNRLADRS
jgi:hypothetical protein